MFQLKEYQQKAVEQLIDFTCDALLLPDRRQQILLKAPTGAGKTVTMASFLSDLMDEVRLRPGLPQEIAVIWIAPNTLHIQSYKALKGFYSELNDLRTLQISDLTARQGLQPKDLLFLNWSSVDKDTNSFRKDGETEQNLETLIEQTRLRDTEVIVVIDEAHMAAFTGDRARKVLQLINAKIEIAVTATPNRNPDMTVSIPRAKVVAAQMIKKGIQLNAGLSVEEQQGVNLDIHLLRKAMQKRDELEAAYRAAGSNINPLLLIQLPSENASLSAEDRSKRQIMESYLETEFAISAKNGLLAVWLSDQKDKINLDSLEKEDALQKVLIFKQAIALGWDCPRAAVIIIFRELGNPTFGIQTVGRILRMPEQKHYDDELLNSGYVYTNIQNRTIQVIQDDLDYFSLRYAKRKKSLMYPNLAANVVINDRQTAGYLLGDFERIFYEQVEARYSIKQIPEADLMTTPEGMEELLRIQEANRLVFSANMWELDVENIEIAVPVNLHIDAYEVTAIVVEGKHMGRFSKTSAELSEMLDRFCFGAITQLNKSKSWKVLRRTLLQFVEYYMGYDEFRARKILLYPQNQERLNELIVLSLENYGEWLKQRGNRSRRVQQVEWSVPEERAYSEVYDEVGDIDSSAMEPYFEYNNASRPEKEFVRLLEQSKGIAWWYKNGDSGKDHFSIAYTNSRNETAQFFVDFVIHFQNGTIGLFETKTRQSDPEAPHKHNALITYMEQQALDNPGTKMVGGVVVFEERNNQSTFRFCRNRIADTSDLTGWEFFDPTVINL